MEFEEASREWRKNKVALGRGWFAYRCQYIHSNARQCPKIVSAQSRTSQYRIREDWIAPQKTSDEYCRRHHIRGPLQRYL